MLCNNLIAFFSMSFIHRMVSPKLSRAKASNCSEVQPGIVRLKAQGGRTKKSMKELYPSDRLSSSAVTSIEIKFLKEDIARWISSH